jgi:DNA-binding CsgD family transcriptional regulator
MGAAGAGIAESVRGVRYRRALQRYALGELTPQRGQLVRLASDSLTDREIGDRLSLSPRTVSSHLYRSYPKLGVASRHQRRDVIARASSAAPAHESAGLFFRPLPETTTRVRAREPWHPVQATAQQQRTKRLDPPR